ncbi:MAG: alpha/beta hydrolase [Actinomycetaceae bacterium]|nr:alpha/beta hydrolase [Actinomycetaceae bacterium]
MIFYHGACGFSGMWENQYDAFPGYDLVFVNVRGQGESPMKAGLPDFEGAVADLPLIMDHFHLDKAMLVGHSWGGNPMQEFTWRHPERIEGLVLSGSWGQHRVMPLTERISLKFTPILYRIIPWKQMAQMAAKACTHEKDTQAMVENMIFTTGRAVFVNLGLSAFREVHPIDNYPNNPPMLFIRGDRDFPKSLQPIYRYLCQKNPNAREAVIPNTVHQPMNDTPQEFNKILGTFLLDVYPLTRQ